MVLARVSDNCWHAVGDDRVIGRGEVSARPDGRRFLSIDVWRDDVFGRLAETMLPVLPKPLYTVVDEADAESADLWRGAGFEVRRREWECLIPTRPAGPSDVAVISPDEEPLAELDRVIRAEVDWQEMPAELLGPGVVDPSLYSVAVQDGSYVGMIRVTHVNRLPRIGLIAVRADSRRRGVGRALLSHALGSLHNRGVNTASAELNETNTAALALFGEFGARRVGSNLELVLR
ncbi:GNAT family N-acetyltransferase [Lentzea aerocolonigenes]|uniref:GNAT family N-acetyltransferase n=1 Tax=Lentzea aerocolonigenes TaxID=68170 RepID=UPI001E48BEA6|nr:GNAT family N-acetyltransferase [Lentzea aerocolonigenes]